jgi:hypothetical protein
MLLFVLLPICLVILGYGLWLTHCRHYERATNCRPSNPRKARKYDIGYRAYMSDSNQYWTAAGAVALGIVLFAVLFVGVSSSQLMVIDEKIVMYQEENAQIEAGVNQIVSKYVEHEEATFAEAVKNISPTMVFFEGLLVYHETFDPIYGILFGFVWTGIVLFFISNLREHRRFMETNRPS